MNKLLSFLFGIDCTCGAWLAPFYNKKISIKLGNGMGFWTGLKCKKCNAIYMQEDGYWSLLTKETLKDLSKSKQKIQNYKDNWKAPDLSKYGL